MIPKPSRATYPCMRVAAPMASSFVVLIIGFLGTAFAFRRARQWWRQSRFAVAALSIGLGMAVLVVRISNATSYLSDEPEACINCHVM